MWLKWRWRAIWRVFFSTLVSAEPAQRASEVSLLNQPTVTAARRAGGSGGGEVGVRGGPYKDTSLMSLWDWVTLVCWCGEVIRELGQADWSTSEIAALCLEQQSNICQARTSTHFDSWTHSCFPNTHTHFLKSSPTWPAPHCTGTWETPVPGCRPDPWRQTTALCPPRFPGIWLCNAAQNHTQDCTKNLQQKDLKQTKNRLEIKFPMNPLIKSTCE